MTEQLKTFNTYEEYLDSHLVEEDLYYLKVATSNTAQYHFVSSKDVESARLILMLGYRSGVKVYGQEDFYKERT